jgi:hypothetical protein
VLLERQLIRAIAVMKKIHLLVIMACGVERRAELAFIFPARDRLVITIIILEIYKSSNDGLAK